MNKSRARLEMFCGTLDLEIRKVQDINVSETIQFAIKKNLKNS